LPNEPNRMPAAYRRSEAAGAARAGVIVSEPTRMAPVNLSDLVVGLWRHWFDGWSGPTDSYLPLPLIFSIASCWAARLSMTRR
jgi:hypothetical protein